MGIQVLDRDVLGHSVTDMIGEILTLYNGVMAHPADNGRVLLSVNAEAVLTVHRQWEQLYPRPES